MLKMNPAAACAIALGVTLGASACSRKSPPAESAAATPAKPAATAPAATPAAAKTTPKDAIDPEAVQALNRMSSYLGTLKTFEITADTTLDLVTEAGQRIQVGGVSHFKARRPNGLHVDLVTDYMNRRFYFDGKQFTVYAPKLGYYATADAPPTIRETLDALYDKYGIAVPLQDLFRWSDPNGTRDDKLEAASYVGPAIVDGVATDHYAFREGQHDWEVWIQQGDRPLPRKFVIVDRTDPAMPAYVARLSWKLNPAVASSDFTFTPGKDAKRIQLATLAK